MDLSGHFFTRMSGSTTPQGWPPHKTNQDPNPYQPSNPSHHNPTPPNPRSMDLSLKQLKNLKISKMEGTNGGLTTEGSGPDPPPPIEPKVRLSLSLPRIKTPTVTLTFSIQRGRGVRIFAKQDSPHVQPFNTDFNIQLSLNESPA